MHTAESYARTERASDPPEVFTTSDIDVATFAAESGAELLEVAQPEPHAPQLAVFVFHNTPALAHALSHWLSDQPVPVHPRELLAKRRHLFRLAKEAVAGGAP